MKTARALLLFLCLLSALSAQVVTSPGTNATALQGLAIKAGLSCAADAYVVTWVAASSRFECLASGAGAGTVTVVGGGSLTSTALVTGGGSQTVQTPSATATLDSSGNLSTPGSITGGSGSGVAGSIRLTQGTAPSVPSNTFGFVAPTSMTTSVLLRSPNAVPAAHQVIVHSAPSSNVADFAYKTVPDCQDTGGQHLNFTQSTDTIACGTSGGGGGSSSAGAPLFVQTASVTVTGNTEATLIGAGSGSLTIPANWFTATGTTMDVCASGLITTAVTPGTVRFKLKFGSTVITDTGAFTPLISVTNGVYDTCVRLTARTVGASGTIMASNIFPMTGSTLTPGENTFTNPTPGTAVTVDTTATQVVDFTVTFSLAATNSITATNFYMAGPGSAISSVNGATGAVTTASTNTYANLPGTCSTGQQFWPTDSFYQFFCTATNIWKPYAYGVQMVLPVPGDFSVINAGSSTLTTTYGGAILSAGGANTVSLYKKTAASTPYTVTATFIPRVQVGVSGVGIGWRQSSDGKLVLFECNGTGAGSIIAQKYTNATTFSANLGTITFANTCTSNAPVTFQMTDDGTNRILKYSNNMGKTFITYATETRTTFLTADEVMFFVNSNDTVNFPEINLIHWQ